MDLELMVWNCWGSGPFLGSDCDVLGKPHEDDTDNFCNDNTMPTNKAMYTASPTTNTGSLVA